MFGSARSAAKVSSAAFSSLKSKAAVLLLPMISAKVVKFRVISFRNVSNSYATKDAQAISKATQQVSMMIQICLRWIEAF
jgi:hypothetical protein